VHIYAYVKLAQRLWLQDILVKQILPVWVTCALGKDDKADFDCLGYLRTW
jgi:hypothetical protein